MPRNKSVPSGAELIELIQQRINAYRDYQRHYCLSDARMRRLLRKRKPDIQFERSKFRVGQCVQSYLNIGTFFIVGHGFTGNFGEKRGAVGCRVGRTTIFKKWEWLGPDEMLRLAETPARKR